MANNKEIKVKLTLDDKKMVNQLSKSLSKTEAQTKQATNNMATGWKNSMAAVAAYTVALTAVVAGVSKVVKAYAEQEESEKKLESAMIASGFYTDKRIEQYKTLASALQKTSVFGDEAILKMMANLQTYGIKNEQVMKKATQATLDLATAKGIDLKAASDLLGKAFVGETGSLSRYGIIIEKGLDKSEKFDAVLQKLSETMGGMAKDATETINGQMKQLSNSFGDVEEKTGGFVFALGTLTAKIAGIDNLGKGTTAWLELWGRMVDRLTVKMNKFSDTTAPKVNSWLRMMKATLSLDLDKYIKSSQELFNDEGAKRLLYYTDEKVKLTKEDLSFNNQIKQVQDEQIAKLEKINQLEAEKRGYRDFLKQTPGEVVGTEDPTDPMKVFMAGLEEEKTTSIYNNIASSIANVSSEMINLLAVGKLSAKDLPKYLAQMAKAAIVTITKESAIRAIFELAMGFATATSNPKASGEHFASAATFGTIAAGGLIATATMGAASSGSSSSGSQSGFTDTGSSHRIAQQGQPIIANVLSPDDVVNVVAGHPNSETIIVNHVLGNLYKNGESSKIIKTREVM